MTTILLILSLILFFSPRLRVPWLDSQTQSYFQQTVSDAGAAYLTVRFIDAAVSVLDHAKGDLEPAGLGISVAPGEILEPVHEMAERTSDVLVTAAASVIVQEMLYEVGVVFAPWMLAAICLLAALLPWINNDFAAHFRRLLIRIAILILVGRFFLPVSAAVNQVVHSEVLAPRIANAKKSLDGLADRHDLDQLESFPRPKVDGFLGTVKNGWALLDKKMSALAGLTKAVVGNLASIVENLVTLAGLYAAVFIIQVILLPLAIFWIMAKLANYLFETKFPTIIRLSTPPTNPKPKQDDTPGTAPVAV